MSEPYVSTDGIEIVAMSLGFDSFIDNIFEDSTPEEREEYVKRLEALTEQQRDEIRSMVINRMDERALEYVYSSMSDAIYDSEEEILAMIGATHTDDAEDEDKD